MTEKELTLGIDLGGTKVALGVVDPLGNIVHREHIDTNKSGPRAVVKDIISASKRLAQGNGNIVAAGVGMAGQIAPVTGIVHFAPNLGWREFPLGDALKEGLGIPVKVINDVRAITWGEWLHGAGKGCNDILCLFVGTGIGGGIVSAGQMLEGSDNAAGEVGHITIDLRGTLCSCGNRGCFETLAAGWAIAQRAKELLAYDSLGGRGLLDIVGGKVEKITAQYVFEASRNKVPLAMKVIEEAQEGLIAGIASLVNTVNPKRLILGGGVIQGNPELMDVIRQGVPRRALKVVSEQLEIVPAALKGEAGVVGTAAFARQK